MNAKTAPVQKSPEEIAREILGNNLRRLAAEAIPAAGELYTHGDRLENVIAINAVNAIIVQTIGNVQAIRTNLKDGLPPFPA